MHGEWILCRVVVSTCWLAHNIAPHISLHDPPKHKTMKKYKDFEGMVVSLLLPRKFAIRTWFCTCQQCLCLFGIVFECIPSIHDRKDVGSPKSTSLLTSFHIGSMTCFFPANLMSSTYTDKNNRFSRCANKHSQVETLSQPYFSRIFSNCLSTTYIRLEVFLPIEWIEWNLSKDQTSLESHQCSNNHQCASPA